MSTVEGLQLIIEERDLLELLCQTRLRRIDETERERDLYMDGERRVEALNEEIDSKLDKIVREQCGPFVRPSAMGFDTMLRIISEMLTNQRKLIDQLEPTCNRIAAFVAEELGRTPEDFDVALTMLINELRRTRAEKEMPF